MAFTGELMHGLAGLLVESTGWTYNTSGSYTAGQVGIVHSVVPATPDRVVVLTPYAPVDHPTMSDQELSVQLRFRGTTDPVVAEDLEDAAFTALQNLPRSVLNGITVVGAWRSSAAYLGVDGNGRHSRVSNYRFLVHRPSTHRI